MRLRFGRGQLDRAGRSRSGPAQFAARERDPPGRANVGFFRCTRDRRLVPVQPCSGSAASQGGFGGIAETGRTNGPIDEAARQQRAGVGRGGTVHELAGHRRSVRPQLLEAFWTLAARISFARPKSSPLTRLVVSYITLGGF